MASGLDIYTSFRGRDSPGSAAGGPGAQGGQHHGMASGVLPIHTGKICTATTVSSISTEERATSGRPLKKPSSQVPATECTGATIIWAESSRCTAQGCGSSTNNLWPRPSNSSKHADADSPTSLFQLTYFVGHAKNSNSILGNACYKS